MPTTRLAPSPTGALHLGNARTFLATWLLARQNDWKIVLRIDDLDGPRIKPGSAESVVDDLRWLGLDWDDGPTVQSTDIRPYRKSVESLLESGAAYYCVCSRQEVARAASAPHAEDGATVYPGTCLGRYATRGDAAATGREPAVRFRVPDRTVTWTDGFAGKRSYRPAVELGDFVIAKADGTPAYQLAVVRDDAVAGVTHVVRGDDLLDSTPRQMLLYESLGWIDRIPAYIHLPLVVGPDGRRLAKRHGDSRLSVYRSRQPDPGPIIRLLARWCGIEDSGSTAASLVGRFDLSKVSKTPVVFDPSNTF